MTEAEYLEYDATHEGKHQYVDGDMRVMEGSPFSHNVVRTNAMVALASRLRSRCQALAPLQRVLISETGMYTYPDIAVVCGGVELGGGRPRTLLNPTVLVEVLSESTQADDRGWKARHYRHRASLKAYLLVGCPDRFIEVYTRDPDGGWRVTEAEEAGDIDIAALGISLPLAEVYDGLEEALAAEQAADEAEATRASSPPKSP